MIGSRECANGDETEAFSRRSRNMVRWGRGEIRRIKRAFSKRMRRAGKGHAAGGVVEL